MRQITGVRLMVASPEEIRAQSSGEVTRPATSDPRTGEPIVGGLFCPRVFGTPALLREYGPGADPSACEADDHSWTRDAADPPSATCGRCGLLLTAIGGGNEQRERFGHVELAVPILHPWFVGAPSQDATLLGALPVLPAGLRPPVERRPRGGTGNSSGGAADPDLNERYRRVIVANDAYARLLAAGAPDPERLASEARLVEAVRGLFGAIESRMADAKGRLRAARRGAALDEPAPVNAPSATVVPDPAFSLDRCGLPRSLALHLFAPLIAGRLVEAGQAEDLTDAVWTVERATPHALAALEQVVADAGVVLSRLPVRRRHNVLAFEPALIDGEAVRLHPLAALALGMDEAHDTVTVRAPLAPVARREARDRMLPSENLLDPANGQLAFEPAADVVLGCYYLTAERYGAKGQDRRFGSWADAIRAYDLGSVFPDAGIDLQARIFVRMCRDIDGTLWEYDPDVDVIDPCDPDAIQADQLEMVWTTIGRVILFKAINDALRNLNADPLPFENQQISRLELKAIITTLIRDYTSRQAAAAIDALMELGLRYATVLGTSLSYTDLATPAKVRALVAEADANMARVVDRYEQGLIDDEDRRKELISTWWWTAINHIPMAIEPALPIDGLINMLERARISNRSVSGVLGMLGLQASASGTIQELPIRSNWGRGLTMHEYSMRTVAVRKGKVATVLRQGHADDLYRRLVAAVGQVVDL